VCIMDDQLCVQHAHAFTLQVHISRPYGYSCSECIEIYAGSCITANLRRVTRQQIQNMSVDLDRSIHLQITKTQKVERATT